MEAPMLDDAGVTAQDQQPRSIPRDDGMLGNQVFRQFVIKVGNTHGSAPPEEP
ncbi:MAG: hypothetical protein BWY76_02733 [bacterium ADurb.Bin429]|nr:MAG: hypothetical protein BWY76_02733 [bacterium ADurb.Bin429]